MVKDIERVFNPGVVGGAAKVTTGRDLNLWEAVEIANAANEWLTKELEKGSIPLWARPSADGSIKSVNPMFSRNELMDLWSKHTKLSRQEMENRIKESGLYAGE